MTKKAVATPGGPSKRVAQALLRREQILAAAERLFIERGFAATSTKRIAEHVGVAEGLVFHYFDTKELLLLELLSKRTTFAGRIATILEAGPAGTARELFAAIAAAYGDVSPEEAAFVAFATAEAAINPAIRAPIALGTALMIDRLTRILRARVRAGELREDASLAAAAHGFFGGFSFFFAQHRDLTRARWRREAAAFGTAWAEQCWRGVASASAIARHDAERGVS